MELLILIAVIILIILGMILSYLIFLHTFLFLYLYIDRGLHTLHNPQKYPLIPITVYVSNYWIELWYQLGKYYLYPIKFFNFTRNERESEYAVLLIHGYGRTQTDLLWFRKQINNLPVFLVNLKPTYAGIDEIAAASIPQRIQHIQKKTGCKKVILIGHSMGGLVASYYSEFLDQNNMVPAVITIGTPYFGTRISIAGAGKNAQQMCPGTKFLAALREKVEHSNKKYHQVATQFENLVFPWDSSVLPHTPDDQKLILKHTPHLTLLHSEEVARQVNIWIDMTVLDSD